MQLTLQNTRQEKDIERTSLQESNNGLNIMTYGSISPQNNLMAKFDFFLKTTKGPKNKIAFEHTILILLTSVVQRTLFSESTKPVPSIILLQCSLLILVLM